MGHTVLELIQKSLLSEFTCLETDFVLKCGVVTEGNLFPRFFLAHTVLLLERVEGAYGKGHVRQCEGIGTVPGVLVVQSIDREVHLSSEIAGIGDGR